MLISEGGAIFDPLTLAIDMSKTDIAEAGGTATVRVLRVHSSGDRVDRSKVIELRFGGSATEGTDYRVSSTELRLSEGENEVSTEITAISDHLIEGRESIIITAIEINPEVGIRERELVGSPQTLTIVDDDMATWSLSVDRDYIEEVSGPPGRAQITVSTGSTTFDSDQTITLALGTNATASDGDDYSVTSRTLTLVAGQATVSTTIVAKPDDLVEGDETIIIAASTNGEAVGATQTVTIRDDDMATWSLSVDRDYIEEVSGPPGRAQITVSTGSATFDSDQTITLALGTNGTASEGDDYSVTSWTLTLVAGQATVSTTIIATPDDLVEGDETIIITASTNGEAVGAAQTVTIRDDDMATWSLSVDPASIEEDEGLAEITVSTGGATFDRNQTITLALGTNGTASEGDDYSVTSRTLTLVAGQATVSTTIMAKPDDLVEDDETIIITASTNDEAVGAAQTVTIRDDDMATWSLSVDRDYIEEVSGPPGRAQITVSTGSATFDSDQTITLALGTNATASDGDDYSVTSRTLTLVAGQATVSTTIVAKPDDLVEGDETIIIAASTNGEAVGAAQTVTIRDDDMATWSLSVDRDYIEEVSGPPGRAQITVSTGSATFDSDQTITLALGTNATASDGDDYSVTSRTLTLVAGQATVSTTIVAKPDDLVEGDETIIIAASTNGEAVGAAQTVTIPRRRHGDVEPQCRSRIHRGR